MPLSWSHPAQIAAALVKTYPDVDRLTIDRAQLQTMIANLDGFIGNTTAPTPSHLDHVLWTWMRMANDEVAA